MLGYFCFLVLPISRQTSFLGMQRTRIGPTPQDFEDPMKAKTLPTGFNTLSKMDHLFRTVVAVP
jgi:hypothetical protein